MTLVSASLFRWTCASLIALAACDGATNNEGAPAPAPASEPAASGAAAPRKGKDYGHATVTIDGAAWAAERCTARVKTEDGGEKLKLACSRSSQIDGRVQTEEIKLVVKDFKGVGDYANIDNSHFTRVVVDTRAANAAADDSARDQVVTDSLAGAKVVTIIGATLSVTAASDAALDGTFAWTPAPGHEGPVLADGKFHAILRK